MFAGPVSGADETLTTYATALHDHGHDVHVVLLFGCAVDDPYYIRLREAGVPVHFVLKHSALFEVLRVIRHLLATILWFLVVIPWAKEFLQNIWQALMTFVTRPRLVRCRNFLKEFRPDVMHIFTPDDGTRLLIQAGHDVGIPVLYHELGPAHHLPMLKGYYRRLSKVLPLCNEVAALSPALAEQWSQRLPSIKMSVLPLIIEQTRAFNLLGNIPRKSSPVVFGFAGRVEQGKGAFVLLEAVAHVNQPQRVATLRIAGAGPELPKAKLRARELKLGEGCEFVGSYSDPLGRHAFMTSLDVFILPSFAEGTPNVIIEAMSHGLPIIATDVGGIADVVGEAGVLVPARDHQALANAILRLVKDSDLRKTMGVAARQRYDQLFSAKAVLPVMLQTYSRVTRNGHLLANALSENGNRHPWAEPNMEVSSAKQFAA